MSDLIRDQRNGNWFWVHKDIMQFKGFKSSTKLVYNALAYFASNHQQKCFPSIVGLQKMLKLSYPSVLNALKELEKYKVISIERYKGKRSVYTLLKVNHLKNLTTKK